MKFEGKTQQSLSEMVSNKQTQAQNPNSTTEFAGEEGTGAED